MGLRLCNPRRLLFLRAGGGWVVVSCVALESGRFEPGVAGFGWSWVIWFLAGVMCKVRLCRSTAYASPSGTSTIELQYPSLFRPAYNDVFFSPQTTPSPFLTYSSTRLNLGPSTLPTHSPSLKNKNDGSVEISLSMARRTCLSASML